MRLRPGPRSRRWRRIAGYEYLAPPPQGLTVFRNFYLAEAGTSIKSRLEPLVRIAKRSDDCRSACRRCPAGLVIAP
jgi:hypothetical protein